MSIGAVPVIGFPPKIALYISLVLIAFGSGGIKPCVSAFGGDQFKMPEQAAQIVTYFSLFYFSINAGSLISTTITPILRADVHCFDDNDCFSLAFGIPAILMLVALGKLAFFEIQQKMIKKKLYFSFFPNRKAILYIHQNFRGKHDHPHV